MRGWSKWTGDRMPTDEVPKKGPRRGSPELHVPRVGDEVRVIRGEHTGKTLPVLSVEGHVYSLEQKVTLDAGCGESVWYYAWDLEKT